jgi:ADP-ribosyl-[dinitrogen reductase] hydrolase
VAASADQIRGSLLGLACGDALASRVRPNQRKAQAVTDSGAALPRPGGITDDTQSALCIAESYAARSGCDLTDIAARLCTWYRTQPPTVDTLTRRALDNVLAGRSPRRSGRGVGEDLPEGMRRGDACLPRAVPTGLVRRLDDTRLIGEARLIGAITHYDERCRMACACVSLALAHILQSGTEGLLAALIGFAGPRNTVIAYGLEAIPDLAAGDLRGGGNVLDTLQAAVWAAWHARSIEDGLGALLSIGGDTHTPAAVGGALLGARFGAAALPASWPAVLSEGERIERCGQQLCALALGE